MSGRGYMKIFKPVFRLKCKNNAMITEYLNTTSFIRFIDQDKHFARMDNFWV